MGLFGIQKENTSAHEIMMKCVFFQGNSYNPLAIYQTHAMDATISRLSLACLDCYPHGQADPILQRKTLALLSADRIVNEIII
jgi:hypothetical protein